MFQNYIFDMILHLNHLNSSIHFALHVYTHIII